MNRWWTNSCRTLSYRVTHQCTDDGHSVTGHTLVYRLWTLSYRSHINVQMMNPQLQTHTNVQMMDPQLQVTHQCTDDWLSATGHTSIYRWWTLSYRSHINVQVMDTQLQVTHQCTDDEPSATDTHQCTDDGPSATGHTSMYRWLTLSYRSHINLQMMDPQLQVTHQCTDNGPSATSHTSLCIVKDPYLQVVHQCSDEELLAAGQSLMYRWTLICKSHISELIMDHLAAGLNQCTCGGPWATSETSMYIR